MIRTIGITVLAAAAVIMAGCSADPASRGLASVGVLPPVETGDISIQIMQDVTRALSSDEFEGRAPGTPGEEKTLALLVEKFANAGLQPGNNGSWFQDVPLVEITASNFQPLAIDGGAEPISLGYGADWVGVTYRETPEIAVTSSELVFAGYGINAPERGWNDYAGLDMRGKTAVILVNDPDYANETLDGPFNGKAMTYYGRWTYKFDEAARQGATAALIVHDTYPAAYGWNVVESSWSGPQAYAERGDGGSDQAAMNGWITMDAAKRIFNAAGQDFDALAQAARNKGFKPVELGLVASTAFENSIRRFASKNVIALLPGAQRPDEYVLHAAHWDHLGRCTANGAGDDICNGAIDNATGTAALIALAQAHKQAGAPARSLVFLAVTAEESGLLGSEYYGANPVFPLSQTVGGVNMDALSMAGPARDVIVVGPGKSQLDAYLNKALAAQNRTGTPNPSPQAGYYYQSDHFSFAKRGLPMLYVDGGEDLVNGGLAAGQAYAAAYDENAYHGPDDEYNPDWDWTGVEQDLQLYYSLGRMLAQSEQWPNWLKGDEFRRLRDESCAGAGGC